MKSKVLEILKSALARAEDDFYRSDMQFGKLSQKELVQEYGQSGRTCGEILRQHKTECGEILACINWAEEKGE